MADRAIWYVMIIVVIKHALNQARLLRWAAWPMHVAKVVIQKLYAIEAELRKKTDSAAEHRREYRQKHSQPVMQ